MANYIYNTQAKQFSDKNGEICAIVRTISEPDATHDIEALPMHVVRFNDGTEYEVWPDELTKEEQQDDGDDYEPRRGEYRQE